ncbi:MAG: hypothetical protein ABIX09_07130, partial [Terrimesophilobacter sp.]
RGCSDGVPGRVVKHSIDIGVPADVVFDVVADPAQHPLIDGSTTVRRLMTAPARLSLGSTFTMSMKLFGLPYWVTNRWLSSRKSAHRVASF